MRPTRVSSFLLAGLLVAGATAARAQVVRLEITSREPMNNGPASGTATPFELIRGKVHGAIDPKDPHNTIIQDLDLAPTNASGKVEYVATFALAKPLDMSKAARVLLYQVVNRGNGQAVASPEGYVSLVSGWQGDVIPTADNQSLVVPIARRPDGSAITGPVLARFYDVPDGATTAPIRLASLVPRSRIPPPVSNSGTHGSHGIHGRPTPARRTPRGPSHAPTGPSPIASRRPGLVHPTQPESA